MASESSERTQRRLFVGARAAGIAGVIVGGIIVGSQLLVGRVYSGAEARQLVAAMADPVASLASAVLAGLATILALMLTLLSLSRRLEEQLGRAFYTRIERIALLSIVDMVGAIALLLLLSAPIQRASEQAARTGDLPVTLTYYLLVGLTAGVAGVFVAIIVMLYNAVQTVIDAVSTA